MININLEITRKQIALHIVQLIYCAIMVVVLIALICCLSVIGCKWWETLLLCLAMLFFVIRAIFSVVFLALVQYAKNIINNGGSNR